MADVKLDEVARDACRVWRDATYISIGFGILAFQRLQVQRRELAQALGGQRDQLEHTARRLVDQAVGAIRPARHRAGHHHEDASATAA